MNRSLFARLTALAVVGVGAFASTTAGAQTADETACRAAIAKNVAKHVDTVTKNALKCHKKRNSGDLPAGTDCNDPAVADTSGKLVKLRAKMLKAVGSGPQSACVDAGGEELEAVLANYARCPSPSQSVDDTATNGSPTDGIDSFDEVAACMSSLAESYASQALADALAVPEAPLSDDLAACHEALAKNLRKLIRTIAKERAACQKAADENGDGLGYSCADADSSGKIADAYEREADAIADACDLPDPNDVTPGNETLDLLKSCGDTVAQLTDCVGSSVGLRAGSGLVAMAYELPATCRAGGVTRIAKSGFGEQLTETSLGAGWNGIGHNLDLADRFHDTLAVDCDDDCANCVLRVDPRESEGDASCRCANDNAVVCDTLNAPDSDDCGIVGDNTCKCFFGPPLATSAGGAPACVSIPYIVEHDGSIDLGTGAWNDAVTVTAMIHLGINLTQPCPVCAGDETPNDGVRDGACVGGTRDTLPCDVNGIHPTFDEQSYDCQPSSLQNISGEGLRLNFAFSTAGDTLPFELPCDAPPGAMCPCRVCSGDNTVGCRNDDECALEGAGTCTGTGGAGVQPNQCTDNPDGDECTPESECAVGPDDTYCDGEAHRSGRGYITCFTNADCQTLDAGNCTIRQRRACYPDPITVGGYPGYATASMGATACIGLTSSPVINAATGLPGAVRVALETDLIPRCANDSDVVYEGPGGSNCPSTPVTTTTTTTLTPPIPCESTVAPLCNGDCPDGMACTAAGLVCECQ